MGSYVRMMPRRRGWLPLQMMSLRVATHVAISLIMVGIIGCGDDGASPPIAAPSIRLHGAHDTTHSYLIAFKSQAPLEHAWTGLPPNLAARDTYSRAAAHAQVSSMLKPFQQHLVAQIQDYAGSYLTRLPRYGDQVGPMMSWPESYGGSWLSGGGVAPPELLLTEVRFASRHQAEQVLHALAASHKIVYAEPNHSQALLQTSTPELAEQYTTASELLYHIPMIKLNRAMSYLEEQPELPYRRPIIAIMDSGVDVQHPALQHQIVDLHAQSHPGARACPGDRYGCNTAGVVAAHRLGNGEVYPIGTSGFNQPCSTNMLALTSPERFQETILKTQYCQHGTLVAGLAAGQSDLVYGACPYCDIVPVKIVDHDLRISDSSILRALEYIALIELKDGRKVKIVNISLGKASKSLSVAMLIRRLATAEGILFVGAAGNDNTMVREYPGSLKDVMAISAIDSEATKISQSNYGGWVSLAAPGYYLLSSIPGGDVKYDHGTSMATPLVAGVAGLVQAAAPTWLPGSEVQAILETTANAAMLYASNPRFKLERAHGVARQGSLGWGLVDALAALHATQPAAVDAGAAPPPQRIGGCATIGLPASKVSARANHNPWQAASGWLLLGMLIAGCGPATVRALRF